MSKWVSVVESQSFNCKEKNQKWNKKKKQERSYEIGLELEVSISTHNIIKIF